MDDGDVNHQIADSPSILDPAEEVLVVKAVGLEWLGATAF